MAKGPVEIWLLDLLKMQMSSLHNIIRSAFYQISDSGISQRSALNHFPAQGETTQHSKSRNKGDRYSGDSQPDGGSCSVCVSCFLSCSTF